MGALLTFEMRDFWPESCQSIEFILISVFQDSFVTHDRSEKYS
jgi:hypothetical protein